MSKTIDDLKTAYSDAVVALNYAMALAEAAKYQVFITHERLINRIEIEHAAQEAQNG